MPTPKEQTSLDIDLLKSSRRVGSYKLDSYMARGGFGTVYRASHVRTGAPAAVKVLHAELFSDPSSTLRFEREAAVVLALPHPNIVKVYECGHIEDGRPYLAMELLAGQSLEARLAAAGRLSAEETLSILEPLANALAAAHARGIVHRDIKPSNAFLAEGRKEGNVVLLDFGIAKLLASQGPALTSSRATLGTIPFMSPEQVRGEGIDTRADVYSLAALAYAMLTGKAPYGNQVTTVLRKLHLHSRPPKPSESAPVDPALDEPLVRALSRDPSERPASTTSLVEELYGALKSRHHHPQTAALPPGITERPAVAVHVEMRDDPAACEDGDEFIFAAREWSFTILSSELSSAGLVVLKETSTHLVAVSPDPPSEALGLSVVSACVRAYRKILDGPYLDCPLEIGVAVHAGALHMNDSGAILPSGLLDVRSWVPPGVSGIAASKPVLGASATNRRPVEGGPGFFWVEI